MLCKCMIIVMVMMSQRSKQRKPCHPQQTTTTKLPLTSQTTHHGKNSKDNIGNFPLYDTKTIYHPKAKEEQRS